jgi:hypothetical protein
MKALKRIFLVLAILVAVLVVVGFFLPKSYRVERSTVINAPAKDVYPHISSFRKWQDWIAWNTAKFPDMTVTFGAQDSGVGASYSWTGKSSGNGAIKFTKVEPDQGIEYLLDFENGKYISNGSITLVPEGAGVRATWVNGGDLGNNPLNRWFGLMMDTMMGPDFEAGLANLKAKAEAGKK